jgi:hypothetical protein
MQNPAFWSNLLDDEYVVDYSYKIGTLALQNNKLPHRSLAKMPI